MPIDVRPQRAKLSETERTLLTATSALVEMHRSQHAAEIHAHDITRGELAVALARVRELEVELGIISEVFGADRQVRPAAMQSAKESPDG